MTSFSARIVAVVVVAGLVLAAPVFCDSAEDKRREDKGRDILKSSDQSASRLLNRILSDDRSALSSLYLMARAHDGALAGGENSAGRTLWDRLFGFVMGQVQDGSSEDGIFYKFDWGITDYAHFTASFKDPVLRDAVKKELDDAAEKEALDKLHPWDDVLIEAQIRIPPKSSEVNTTVKQLRGALVVGSAKSVSDLSGDGRRDELFAAMSDFTSEEADSAMKNAIARVLEDSKNENGFHLTGRFRAVDESIGQEEWGVGLTYKWGEGTSEGREPQDLMYEYLYSEVKNSESKPTHTFAAEGSWTNKEAINAPGSETLGVKKFEEVKASLNWSTKFARESFTFDGMKVGVGNSLTLSYMRPNEDFANERWIASNVTTFTLSNGQAIPLTVTWANKEEFIDADVVTGHLGFSLNLSRAGR